MRLLVLACLVLLAAGCTSPAAQLGAGSPHVALTVIDEGPREARVNVSVWNSTIETPVTSLVVAANGSAQRDVAVLASAVGEVRLLYSVDYNGLVSTGFAKLPFDMTKCSAGSWIATVTLRTTGDVASPATTSSCGPG